MINKKMEKALNDQVNAELYSAYLYLSMGAHFNSAGLSGMAHWMRLQAQEELGHGMKIYDYINSRGGKVTLRPIEGPQTEWKSVLQVFEDVYKHEQKVTGLINKLVDLSISENDHAANSFLQWFVNEQVEEEENASAIVEKLKRIEDSPQGLYTLDKELGNRGSK